jgi:hypothetical protein
MATAVHSTRRVSATIDTGTCGIRPIPGLLPGDTPTRDVYNGNNQISGNSYDGAGNLLTVNGNTAKYDAENRLVQVTEARRDGDTGLRWHGAAGEHAPNPRGRCCCGPKSRALGVRKN